MHSVFPQPGAPQVGVYKYSEGCYSRAEVSDELQGMIMQSYKYLWDKIAPGSQTFTINFSQVNITYENNGVSVTEGLLECNKLNPNELKVLQGIIIRLGQEFPNASTPHTHPREPFSELKGYKSYARAHAMVRNHSTLQKLPTKYSDCALFILELIEEGAEQDAALRRIAAAECIIKPQLEIIQEQLAKKKADLVTQETKVGENGNEAKCEKIRKEIQALENLSRFDRFALYMAAAFAPTIDPAVSEKDQLIVAHKAAEAAFEALYEKLSNKGVLLSSFPKDSHFSFLRGTPDSSPELREYCVDVAALIFSVLPPCLARKGAQEFWEKHNVVPKMHTIEDDVIKSVGCADPNRNVSGECPIFALTHKTLSGIEHTSAGKSRDKFVESNTTKATILSAAQLPNTPQNAKLSLKKKIERLGRAHHLEETLKPAANPVPPNPIPQPPASPPQNQNPNPAPNGNPVPASVVEPVSSSSEEER